MCRCLYIYIYIYVCMCIICKFVSVTCIYIYIDFLLGSADAIIHVYGTCPHARPREHE